MKALESASEFMAWLIERSGRLPIVACGNCSRAAGDLEACGATSSVGVERSWINLSVQKSE